VTPAGEFRRIDVAAARDLMRRGGALMIDIRDAESFRRGHIEGAQLVTEKTFARFLAETPRETPVIVCCYHGQSSRPVAGALAEAGFAKAYSLDGGYEAWAAAQRAGPAAAIPSAALRAFLVERGFMSLDVNARDRDGATPLMHAVRLGPPEHARELLRAGADLHAANPDGNQALWLACVGEISENIQLLIDAGAELQHVNATGATPLMFAASSGRARALALLLAAGADPLFETELGMSALDLASTPECLNLMRAAIRRRNATPPRA
jgi:rhodanese-related sulfurtransferase